MPGIGETLFRAALFSGVQSTRRARAAADVLITPGGAGAGFLEFHQLDALKEEGRRAAREALERAEPVLL
jgi:predicted acylesterase/phospholipase RssA